MIRHPANARGRDYFVGDLHGEYDRLMAALEAVSFDGARDRLFSVGDLIDRGPRSQDCLALTREPWFFSVCGNHELLARDALARGGEAMALWVLNGGGWSLEQDRRELGERLEEVFHHLPYAREIAVGEARIGLVHAEPPADWSRIDEADRHDLVWVRRRIQRGDATPVSGIDAVVVGHTVLGAPTTLGNVHYIDTGAYATGRLTLVEAPVLLAGKT